jgi:DsbC/DsbD-like thiol-disulfide interchange protein
MASLPDTLRTNLTAVALALTFGGAALAADASPWADDKEAAARLIAGARQDGKLNAGVEIKMAPGWHTYWRYPGDSGVPPRFDFSGSTNVAAAEVLYPAPHLFSDETGNSLGYTGDVVFPVQVTPREAGKPAVLRVKLDYAICEKLCVPAEAQLELPLDGAAGGHAARLAAAQARVPKPVAADALGLSVRRAGNGAKPSVTVDLKPPAGEPLQVFVEGPTPEWALPIPQPIEGAPAGRQRLRFALDGLPPGTDAKKPVELTFTVIAGAKAYEVTTHLD